MIDWPLGARLARERLPAAGLAPALTKTPSLWRRHRITSAEEVRDALALAGAGWRPAVGGLKISGHKMGAVYWRYAIVSNADLAAAAQPIAAAVAL